MIRMKCVVETEGETRGARALVGGRLEQVEAERSTGSANKTATVRVLSTQLSHTIQRVGQP